MYGVGMRQDVNIQWRWSKFISLKDIYEASITGSHISIRGTMTQRFIARTLALPPGLDGVLGLPLASLVALSSHLAPWDCGFSVFIK